MHASASADRSRNVSSRSAQPARSRHAMRTMCRLRKRRSDSITSASFAPLTRSRTQARTNRLLHARTDRRLEPARSAVPANAGKHVATNSLQAQTRGKDSLRASRREFPATRCASCSRAASNRASMSVNSRLHIRQICAHMRSLRELFPDDGVAAPTRAASNLLRCISVSEAAGATCHERIRRSGLCPRIPSLAARSGSPRRTGC